MRSSKSRQFNGKRPSSRGRRTTIALVDDKNKKGSSRHRRKQADSLIVKKPTQEGDRARHPKSKSSLSSSTEKESRQRYQYQSTNPKRNIRRDAAESVSFRGARKVRSPQTVPSNDVSEKELPGGHAVVYREIPSDYAGQRLDNHLVALLKDVPKSKLYQIVRKGELRVNGKRIKPDYRLQAGDVIRIPPLHRGEPKAPDLPSLKLLKARLPLESMILFENKSLLVINKPAGLAVHGGSKTPWGIIEALRVIRDDIHFLELVHRLDRDTSGVLLLAKKRSVLRALHRALANNELKKEYLALLVGRFPQSEATVNLALDKNHYQGGERMVRVSRDGKPALTHFKVLKRLENATFVSVRLETGRTHQIRVHAQYLGHPIIGDPKYGDCNANQEFVKSHGIDRMWLHAEQIVLPTDSNEAPLEELAGLTFRAPLDPMLEKIVQSLISD